MDPKKVANILDWKAPRDVQGIKSFIGMIGYYRHFIEGFSKIAKPLTALLPKKVEFKWTLVSHPVLEGKPNANHVRARISNSRTQQLHNMDIITQCSNSNIKRGIIVDYIICLRHPHSLYNNQSAETKGR
jgi:hypothetical protein